jgi:glutamate racemase
VIGVFDSGVGGLSVWREIASLMPDEPLLYLADQAHVPYGPRSLAEVHILTARCVAWMIQRGCQLVVIACNTASAAALHPLRAQFDIPFVGMEPAVKPAASHTHSGVIGVLATQATFQGELFASVVMRFAAHVKVIEQACPGWVEMVESGMRTPALIDCYVLPLLDAGADSLVLGCTHFPFLAPAIRDSIAGWLPAQRLEREIELIDPSIPVARQTLRVRDQHGLAHATNGATALLHQFWTTGNATAFTRIARQLLPAHPHLQAHHIPYTEVCAAARALLPQDS